MATYPIALFPTPSPATPSPSLPLRLPRSHRPLSHSVSPDSSFSRVSSSQPFSRVSDTSASSRPRTRSPHWEGSFVDLLRVPSRNRFELFPYGQLTYMAGEGLTSSAFLPLFGGLLQAQGRYLRETRISFSCKDPESSGTCYTSASSNPSSNT
ncbi:hypothetical protein ACMD2_18953 [Ananas comosus]|uniref:Uncharacterized protein n=1 Tax=Ananas comosus TaxID=4615 RepID=A0A199V0A1_ANACO|nr:hypothetical protein ACMD2_18953 [Ananas comosus]